MNLEVEPGVSNDIELLLTGLYQDLLQSWNNQDANKFAGFFAANGNSVGFDGSQMNGVEEITDQITQIFHDHKVASYVGIVREVRQISVDVFLLRAVAGMIPPGESQIKADVNSIQTLILQKRTDNENFRIALFQNTPAAFHGRPELSKQLTAELQIAADTQNDKK